ncbi:MAG: ATP-binding cassette domain-containing protein, partial [Methanobrevibacter sp.]|nr:ATP-binding cassette domain-containing protein [Methanobrevibacter sp.]
LERPSDGEALINNKTIDSPSPEVGVVFQDYSLFSWMNVYENLYFAIENNNKTNKKGKMRKLSKEEIDKRVINHLNLVGLLKFRDKFPKDLSGGMKQKLAISRMFALNSKVFLMDEPFGALDALNRIYMQDFLLELWNKKKQTTVYISHDIEEAILLSDKIVVMTPSPGKIKEIIDIPFKRDKNGRRNRLYLNENIDSIHIKNHIFSLLDEEMKNHLSKQEEEKKSYLSKQEEINMSGGLNEG